MKKNILFLALIDLLLTVVLICRVWNENRDGRVLMTGGAGIGVTEDTKNANVLMPKIALTFDDGPHPKYTEELLDGLSERGVHATFFVTGEHASLHPDIIERMTEEGHLIGNHTYSHIQLTPNNEKEFIEELKKTNTVLYDITGESTEFVRPPYGCWNRQIEEELNMFPVLWTIDPEDWKRDNAPAIAGSVIRKAEENDIILMHDYYSSSVEAALLIVDELQKEGYEFVTVDEILFD